MRPFKDTPTIETITLAANITITQPLLTILLSIYYIYHITGGGGPFATAQQNTKGNYYDKRGEGAQVDCLLAGLADGYLIVSLNYHNYSRLEALCGSSQTN